MKRASIGVCGAFRETPCGTGRFSAILNFQDRCAVDVCVKLNQIGVSLEDLNRRARSRVGDSRGKCHCDYGNELIYMTKGSYLRARWANARATGSWAR